MKLCKGFSPAFGWQICQFPSLSHNALTSHKALGVQKLPVVDDDHQAEAKLFTSAVWLGASPMSHHNSHLQGLFNGTSKTIPTKSGQTNPSNSISSASRPNWPVHMFCPFVGHSSVGSASAIHVGWRSALCERLPPQSGLRLEKSEGSNPSFRPSALRSSLKLSLPSI